MSVDCEITILVLLSNNQTRKQQQRCGPKHSEPTVILGAAAPQTPRGASVLSGLRLNASMSIGATQGMHPPVGHACAVRARWSWSTCRRVSRVQGQSIPQRIKIKTTMPVLSACVCVWRLWRVCVGVLLAPVSLLSPLGVSPVACSPLFNFPEPFWLKTSRVDLALGVVAPAQRRADLEASFVPESSVAVSGTSVTALVRGSPVPACRTASMSLSHCRVKAIKSDALTFCVMAASATSFEAFHSQKQCSIHAVLLHCSERHLLVILHPERKPERKAVLRHGSEHGRLVAPQLRDEVAQDIAVLRQGLQDGVSHARWKQQLRRNGHRRHQRGLRRHRLMQSQPCVSGRRRLADRRQPAPPAPTEILRLREGMQSVLRGHVSLM